jgi:signal peptidase II
MISATAHGPARWPIFGALAAVVVVVDQLSKAWLVSFLDPGERTPIVGDLVRLVHSQNTGALFGLFKDQALLFGVVSIGVVGLIVWFHRSSGRNTMLSVALGLLLGGAIGNMIDRFRLGYVIDWVDAGIGDLRFYTFNVADSAISVSILLLILTAFLPAPGATDAATDTPRAGEPDRETADA